MNGKDTSGLLSGWTKPGCKGDAGRMESASRRIPGIFAASLFMSALLLFSVQPMIARLLLPLLGGSPQVWNGCMLFFQAILLAGYGLAHFMARRLPLAVQFMIGIGLLAGGALVLPFELSPELIRSVPRETDPVGWLFRALFFTVGAPCLLLSICSPLLQAWFAGTSHPRAREAYFLYQASNLGSLVALAGYVALVEPRSTIPEQARAWRIGYLALGVLLASCAWLRSRFPGSPEVGDEVRLQSHPARSALAWLALSFIPSSLMLGVTTHLSTDVATHPLLWVMPFILYLVAFILAFETDLDASRWSRPFAGILVLWAATMVLEATQPIWILLHLLTFFQASFVCLSRVSALRPPASDLTRFYLCLAAGGVLGGVFNALLAPRLFDRPLEYPLVMLVTSALVPAGTTEIERKRRPGPLLGIILAGAAAAGAILAGGSQDEVGLAARLPLALPLSLCFLLRHHPAHFAAGLLAVLLVPAAIRGQGPSLVLRHRNFFGVSTVTREAALGVLQLEHGVTVHGRQYLDEKRSRIPLTYYHPTGPAGDVFQMVASRQDMPRVAVVGLGVGSLASYATSVQHWTFFEIDPFIVTLARDMRHFTFLAQSRARSLTVEIGDARLRLGAVPPASYDLLALDAFSSDAIPMHLLTRESLRLYVSRVREGGIVTMHVSNQYLDLRPVVARLAQDAGLEGLIREHSEISDEARDASVAPSTWVVLTKDRGMIEQLVATGRWERLVASPDAPLWTDDSASILPLLRWY